MRMRRRAKRSAPVKHNASLVSREEPNDWPMEPRDWLAGAIGRRPRANSRGSGQACSGGRPYCEASVLKDGENPGLDLVIEMGRSQPSYDGQILQAANDLVDSSQLSPQLAHP